MIHERTPVTLAEVKDVVDKLEEKQELKDYLKKFTKLKLDKAEKLKEEIQALNNLKIKQEHIVKIVDFLPKGTEEVKKIFADVGLSEEETNAIVEIVNKY